MRKIISIILGLAACILSYSQDNIENYEIGRYVDINKTVIDDYFDFTYEPDRSLEVSFVIGQYFTPGYYYTIGGEKIKGLLKYSQSNTYFKFKSSENEKEKTIHPDECIGYVIGADSFTVIENFDVQRKLAAFESNKKEFAEVIDKVENITFYKHTRAGMQNIVTTYLVKADTARDYTSFPKQKSEFKKIAIDIFGEFESLKSDIQSGKYKEHDIPTIIKIFKYKKKYDKQEKIYFNVSWDEIDINKEYSYYASIDSLKDSVFHIKYYFKNNIPIYEGNFTSFYPHKKKGDFLFYYPNGTIRKMVNYQNNKPKSTKVYNKNGSIHFTYRFSDDGIVYYQVNDLLGQNILDQTGTGTEVYHDSITNRQITYVYLNRKLTSVYYIDSTGKKVYQLCDKNAGLKGFADLKSKIKNKFDYPVGSIEKNNHGYVLIKCIIEPSGLLADLEIIKGIDRECNTEILNFLSYLKSGKYCWPGKINGVKVTQEIVIPIDFSIQGFSWYRNHYNNFWMHQNMMMQQQMMRQPKIPTPTYRF